MKKYSFAPFILTLTVITMLHSCTSDQTVYEEYQKFENLSWNRFNRLEYVLQVEPRSVLNHTCKIHVNTDSQSMEIESYLASLKVGCNS